MQQILLREKKISLCNIIVNLAFTKIYIININTMKPRLWNRLHYAEAARVISMISLVSSIVMTTHKSKMTKISTSKISTSIDYKEKKNTYKTLLMCVDDNFKHGKPDLLQKVV